MTTPDPRARIISHMNKEHSADLSRYLQAFNNLSASSSRGAHLTDLTLSTLTIQTASGTQHIVPITPPMTTFASARDRLVSMAQLAQTRLGLSDIRITKCMAPQGAGLVSFIGVAFYFLSAAALAAGFLHPGNAALWDALDAYFPYRGAEGFVWSVRAIALPVAVIHFSEAWYMARSRLARFGVETGSAVWWGWVAKTFMEGFPAFRAFDGLVAEERARKDAVRH